MPNVRAEWRREGRKTARGEGQAPVWLEGGSRASPPVFTHFQPLSYPCKDLRKTRRIGTSSKNAGGVQLHVVILLIRGVEALPPSEGLTALEFVGHCAFCYIGAESACF